MNKIKLVKTNGVKFNAIDVPVNVCNKTCHLVVPFICAAKHVVGKDGKDVSISYSCGISEKDEDLIINYYNDFIIRVALSKMFNSGYKLLLGQVFEKHSACFYSWSENEFLSSVGLRACYSASNNVKNIVKLLLDEFSCNDKISWCVNYVDNYFKGKSLAKEWNGYFDNIEDIKILEEIKKTELYDELIEDVLNNEEWNKRFVKNILLPYVKERKKIEEKKQAEIKRCEETIATLEKEIKEAKRKIEEANNYLCELR